MNASAGLGWTSRWATSQPLMLALPLALAVVLFLVDLKAPDRMIFGLPYLLVVILSQAAGGAPAALVSGVASAVMVLVSPVLTSAHVSVEPAWMGWMGRLIVAASVGMMVVFLRQRDEAREILRDREKAADTQEPVARRKQEEMRLVNAQLHREIAERRRAEMRSGYLASIVESSADAIIGVALDGSIVSWNNGASRVYGHSRDAMIGSPSSRLLPPQHEQELADLMGRIARGEHVDEVEGPRLRSDGTLFDVAASFSPIHDDKGAIIGVSLIERDITRRVQAESALQSLNAELEAKVHQRTEQLEVANGELEAFSYSVSHDLRAPLRALRGFTDTLVEEAGENLTDEQCQILGRVHKAAMRMDRTIEDLLMLSRVGNDRLEKEVVNLGEIAETVVEDLEAASPHRRVQWEIGEGLLAWGDPGLLRLVVQNLLGNAFKYTGNREEAHVAFGVEERGAESVTYFVRDDGAGFEQGQAGSLFRPFARLHAREEFDGAGIGLATVDRILRRHGGSVWAEGRKGEGATFRFRLPVPPRTRSASDDEFAADEGRG